MGELFGLPLQRVDGLGRQSPLSTEEMELSELVGGTQTEAGQQRLSWSDCRSRGRWLREFTGFFAVLAVGDLMVRASCGGIGVFARRASQAARTSFNQVTAALLSPALLLPLAPFAQQCLEACGFSSKMRIHGSYEGVLAGVASLLNCSCRGGANNLLLGKHMKLDLLSMKLVRKKLLAANEAYLVAIWPNAKFDAELGSPAAEVLVEYTTNSLDLQDFFAQCQCHVCRGDV